MQRYTYEESVELNANVIMDFDSAQTPCAIELLSASKLFKINKSYFNNISNLKIKINKENINKIMKTKCINDLNVPIFDCKLVATPN